jgi:flavin reductase (DIM6/NTAB) family NADH-FMN oxidoreductase RutF
MRAWTTGVAIATVAYNGEQHGMTVSSFASVSLDPPWIAVSMQTASRTHELVTRAQAFGVTMLASDQQDLSERFAGGGDGGGDRLDGLRTETLVTGALVYHNREYHGLKDRSAESRGWIGLEGRVQQDG